MHATVEATTTRYSSDTFLSFTCSFFHLLLSCRLPSSIAAPLWVVNYSPPFIARRPPLPPPTPRPFSSLGSGWLFCCRSFSHVGETIKHPFICPTPGRQSPAGWLPLLIPLSIHPPAILLSEWLRSSQHRAQHWWVAGWLHIVLSSGRRCHYHQNRKCCRAQDGFRRGQGSSSLSSTNCCGTSQGAI